MGQRVELASNRKKRYTTRKNAAHGLRLRIDVPLLSAIITLLVFGVLMVFSASWDVSLYLYGSHSGIFLRQLAFLGIGTVAMTILAFVNYHWFTRLVVPAMALAIIFLISVLVIGEVRLGSARTLFRGSFQPSEFAKLVTILYLAVWLFAKQERLHDVSLGLIPLGAILGLLGGLIFIQPDLSATLTIFALGMMLFFLAGGDIKQISLLVLVAVLVGGFIVWVNPTGSERMGTYLPGLKDPLEASYHVRRSLGAFVNGGWGGTGISNGTVKLNNLPLPHSDSIFAVVGEELGVWGSSLLVILFGVILWRGLVISRNAPDELGRLIAAGLSFWLVMEAFFNMAGILGLLPFAGNALPFISYGGSSLIISMIAVGILLNISRLSVEKQEQKERRTFSEVVGLRRWNRRGRVSRTRRARSSRK